VFGYKQVGIEVIGAGSRAEVERNTVRGSNTAGGAGAPIGIQISDGARAEVEGNSVSGNLGNATNEGVGILVFQTSNVEVKHNFVFGNDEGILLAALSATSTSAAGPRVTNTEVKGNVVFQNTFNGIGLVNADKNTIENNDTSFNGFDGINVGSSPSDPPTVRGTATGNVIRGNEARLNGRAGIFLEANATGNTVTNNRLRNNNTNQLTTGADAVDLSTGTGTAGTLNTWKGNSFRTSIPLGLR